MLVLIHTGSSGSRCAAHDVITDSASCADLIVSAFCVSTAAELNQYFSSELVCQ